ELGGRRHFGPLGDLFDAGGVLGLVGKRLALLPAKRGDGRLSIENVCTDKPGYQGRQRCLFHRPLPGSIGQAPNLPKPRPTNNRKKARKPAEPPVNCCIRVSARYHISDAERLMTGHSGSSWRPTRSSLSAKARQAFFISWLRMRKYPMTKQASVERN